MATATEKNPVLRQLGGELFGDFSYRPPAKKAKLDPSVSKAKESDAPAWEDPEDAKLTIDLADGHRKRKLRTDFEENEISGTDYITRQRKHYADCQDDDWSKPLASDKTTTFVSKSHGITAASSILIDNDRVSFRDLGSINDKSQHNAVVTVLQFSSDGKILMSGGLDKTLSLYSMESEKHELLKKVFMADMPVRCATFSHDNKEVIIGGRRFFLYALNLINLKLQRVCQLLGRDERSWEVFAASPNNKHIMFVGVRGAIIVVSRHTKMPVKTLQLGKPVVMLKFNTDGSKMFVLIDNGSMYVFDMKTYRCVDKVLFDGIVKATCFDLCLSLDLVVVGCNSGVVSVYDYVFGEADTKLLTDVGGPNRDKKVTKGSDGLAAVFSVNSLLTTIHGVKFNHDGQLLLMWSSQQKQAVRLVHVQTGTVYSNWPVGRKETLSYVHQATFSPNSGFVALGNDHGNVKLVRLDFYGNV